MPSDSRVAAADVGLPAVANAFVVPVTESTATCTPSLTALSREPKRGDLIEVAHLLLSRTLFMTLPQLITQPFQHAHLLMGRPQACPDLQYLHHSFVTNAAEAIAFVP